MEQRYFKIGRQKNRDFPPTARVMRRERRRAPLVLIEKLVEELAKTGNVYKAMSLVSEYYEICGKEEALRDLAMATNNFEI